MEELKLESIGFGDFQSWFNDSDSEIGAVPSFRDSDELAELVPSENVFEDKLALNMKIKGENIGLRYGTMIKKPFTNVTY